METSSRPRVRLAELVAALSLGVDLGFGQPMEHVLRQCLIALRLAERIGLDDEERATVYYTALLITVGCHTDAHEQAKWFGDDIALKATKYDFDRSPRVRLDADARRGPPAASPLPRRARVRPLRSPRGGRDDRAPRRDRPAPRGAARAADGGSGVARVGVRAVGRSRLAGRLGRRGHPAPGESRTARGVRRGRASRRRGRGGGQARAGAKRQAVRPGAGGAGLRRKASCCSPGSIRSRPGRP